MANPHEPFTSLGPIDWEDVPQDTLPEYLEDIFSEAQTVVDSIPSTHPSHDDASQHQASAGRARAQTDPAVLNAVPATAAHSPKPRARTPAAIAQSQKLQKEWKEVKVNPRENPHDVKVYKLGSKDGKGAWFARSSLHEGLSFEQWKDGLQREFMETMKVQGQPGSGSIRGIGADKRVENHDLHDAGHVQGKTPYSECQTGRMLTMRRCSVSAVGPVPGSDVPARLHHAPPHIRCSSADPRSFPPAAQTVHDRVQAVLARRVSSATGYHSRLVRIGRVHPGSPCRPCRR